VDTTGEFKSIDDLRNVVIGASPSGAPLYLRDLVDIDRGYENPPSFLNRYTRRDENGRWITTRAITLSVQMKKGEQIGSFGNQVNTNLAAIRKTLPADLVMARTSDQPLQVHDSIELFSHSLIEALILVVVVALIGFWSWRTAILIAVSDADYPGITFGVISSLESICNRSQSPRSSLRWDYWSMYPWCLATRLCANWARVSHRPSPRGWDQRSCSGRWRLQQSRISSPIFHF